MKHTSSTDLRKNLSTLMDQVNDDHEPLLVTRASGKAVVMLSVEDYQAMDETAYLLASPENARRLRLSIDQIEQGQVVQTSADALDSLSEE
ncbi:MAG: type II toxin-antitoxin system prevent-host-death family antitoxin [Rhodobacteraceae bacterium]|nr:MAG: type II toxin-antitoxin system prevent-host-death family antitoxin [Paracoccaceae bacterium]